MPRKVIIDADPGIGDALAIALALLDPEIDLIGVTAVAGCVTGPVATQNLLSIVEAVDPPKWPRFGASTAGRPRFTVNDDLLEGFFDPLRLNGDYGLGKSEVQFAQLANQRDSARMMIDLVRNNPHQVTLLTLGPLTNVATASELAPDFLSNLQQLVCLGGSIGAGGDVTAAAEFNVFCNPMAATLMLNAPVTKTLIPLDVSSQPVLSFDLFNRIRQTVQPGLNWFFDELIPFTLRAHHEQLGLEGWPLREVAALAFLTQPRHFGSSPMSVGIEQSGTLTRGVTVIDQRRIPRWQTNCEVVESVDAQGVLDYFGQLARRSA